MADGLSRGVSSAIEAKRLQKELNQADAGIKLTNAQSEATTEQKKVHENTAKKTAIETKLLESTADAVKSESEVRKKQAEIDKDFTWFDAGVKRLQNVGGAIGSFINGVITNSAKKVPQNNVPSAIYKRKDGTTFKANPYKSTNSYRDY